MQVPRHGHTIRFVRQQLFDNLTNFRELERRLAGLPTEHERGDAFEVFAEAYLATQPIEKAKNVWPGKRIPEQLRRRLRLHSRDVGVDGLVETVSGTLRAYQVKFRTGRPALRWEETATFFGLTDRCRERVLFTNCDDISAVMDERRDFSSIRGCDLDRLEASDFKAIRDWLRGAQVVRQIKKPRPHQTKALRVILPALRKQNRVTALMACGTGKTQVGLWTAEAIAKRRVLVLVPSLALLRQTLKEWVNQTRWNHYDYLCVCSDPTVSRGEDELVIRPTELEFSVSTEPRQVRQFLRRPFNGVKIIFSTYQSADVVAKGMWRGDAFDLAIFDEAHKTAGRDGTQFSFALKDKNLPIRKRLFLTATPRHYNLQKRDKEGDPVEVFSMNRPEIYGPVVHNLTFAEAARRGIICNYKVIISVVTSKELTRQQLRHGQVPVKRDRVKAAQVANQIALAQAVRRHPIRKIFTFHRTVDSAASFVTPVAAVYDRRKSVRATALAERRYSEDSGEGIQNHLPQFGAFHVRGSMSSAIRERVMDEFRGAPKALMSNARCLTEGIDCPVVDMVAFLTPKRSRVDIVQATGRAMRRDPVNPSKLTGYIFVPLYVEQAKGESLEAAIERTEFDEVWAVLQAMQEQDDVLDDRIHYVLATGQKTKGFNDAIICQRVEITGPAVALGKLRRAISVKCLDRIGRSWDTMVQQLLLFKKRFGHCRVPRHPRWPWRRLGEWVSLVRGDRRQGVLSSARIAELDGIGFCWRVDGQTLDDTAGLLNENQFAKASALSSVGRYRKSGLITPVGFAMAGPSLSAFYHPSQIKGLKKKLGITLEDTQGLLNEYEFKKESSLSQIYAYRRQGLIKPIGFAMAGPGVSAFYSPRQIRKLKRRLGITLDKTTNLLGEQQFKEISRLTKVSSYRRKGLIKPVGFALAGSSVTPFYRRKQIRELQATLGITLRSTKGLLNEQQFMTQSGLSNVRRYRELGLIKPVGRAMAGSSASYFYHPRQIKELKKALGITLNRTLGLYNESTFEKVAGLRNIVKYRKTGLIKPVGRAMAGQRISYYYHPKQAKDLHQRLGITLHSTTGLLNERQFADASGLSQIAQYRKSGLIKPIGYAMAGPRVGAFYHPRQIKALRKVLGITLETTKGLLNESQFRKASRLSQVGRYREQGLITPIGRALQNGGLSYFYHPRQVSDLRRTLAVTLDSTKGLISESRFGEAARLGAMAKYRKQGLIKPAGKAMVGSVVSYFYRPQQIKELKKKLGITLETTEGLLNESQFRKLSRLSNLSRYREQGLIKPIGKGMAGPSVGYFYHPKQVLELRKTIGITLGSTAGLFNESRVYKVYGLKIGRYRKANWITPVGRAISGGTLAYFYHPRQIKELKAKLKALKHQV